MKKAIFPLSLGAVAAASLLAFPQVQAQTAKNQDAKMTGQMGVTKAIAVLHPTQGNNVTGTVTFTKAGKEDVRIVADIQGLSPGKHGFHVHEYGDCSAPDASSAGGHFNPYNAPHAASDVPRRHVGDLGNIVADASGKAHLEMTRSLLDFQGPASILGRAVVVHAKEDDLKSQPSGDAGGRVACGVIGVAKP